MRFAFFFFAFCFVTAAQAQSLKKPFKALNEGLFDEAASGFDEYKLKDSLDPQLWFGYARLFAEPAFKMADLFMSWQYILKSRSLYESLDEKGLKKLGEELTPDSLNVWQTLIDDRLFERVQIDTSISICEHHLLDCELSTHRKSVVIMRNQRAYAQACRINSVASFSYFMTSYPTATEYEEAKVKRASAAARDALATKTDESCVAFLSEYPDAQEYRMVFDTLNEIRLRYFLDNVSDSLYEVTCFNFYISDSGQYKVNQSVYDRAFEGIRKYESAEYWVYYISEGNIFRMNESDMKAEEFAHDGNIKSFAVNSAGDVVYYRIAKPELMEFFSQKKGQSPVRLYELKTAEVISSYESGVTPFYISDDLSIIFMEFWLEPEAWYTRRGVWKASTNKWKICTYDMDNCDLGIIPAKDVVMPQGSSTACPDTNDDYFTRINEGVYELYKKKGGNVIQMSHTSDIKVRSAWGDESECFYYSVSATKIFFYFIEECGDFCYGPCYVANLDGTSQSQITTGISIADLEAQWLYVSGDLLWIDESSNLIRFTGKEQTRELLVPQVTMVKTVHIAVSQ